MAALDLGELLRTKQVLAPMIVPVLRRMRAQGVADPVATVKSQYQDNSGIVSVKARLIGEIVGVVSLTAITIDPGDFNVCVDLAALQL